MVCTVHAVVSRSVFCCVVIPCVGSPVHRYAPWCQVSWFYSHSVLLKEALSRYRKLDNKLNKLTQLQTMTPHLKQDFHPRLINNTQITFTDNEMTLLQKGPKYNPHTKKKDCIQNLALETETAISKLPPFRTRRILKTSSRAHQHPPAEQQPPN